MKKMIVIFTALFMASCGESVPGNTGLTLAGYDLTVSQNGGATSVVASNADESSDRSEENQNVYDKPEDASQNNGSSGDTSDDEDGGIIIVDIDTSIMQSIFSHNGIGSFNSGVGWAMADILQVYPQEVEEDETVTEDPTMINREALAGTDFQLPDKDALVFNAPDIGRARPVPDLSPSTIETAWLVAFETTGGALKYVQDYEEGSVIEHGRTASFDGVNVICDSYMEGVGKSPKGDGSVKVVFCRQKGGEVGVGKNSHGYIYWDYISLDFDRFEFWSPCLGSVRISGKVTPAQKGISTYYDVMHLIESTYVFNGDLTYGVDNGSFYGFIVKFDKMVRRVSSAPDPDIDDFAFNGNIVTGAKTFQLVNPDPFVDDNGIKTGLELPPPSKVVECWNKLD